jgi:hypothetical protein
MQVSAIDGCSALEWSDTIDVVSDGKGGDVITGRPIGDNVQPSIGGQDNVQTLPHGRA